MQPKKLQLNIRPLLNKRKMNIKEFAIKANLTYATAHAHVTNKRDRIELTTLAKMCQALECKVGDLFVWE